MYMTPVRIMVAVLVLTIVGGAANTIAPGVFLFFSLAVLVVLLVGIPLFGRAERDQNDLLVLDSVWDLVPTAAMAFGIATMFFLLPLSVPPRASLKLTHDQYLVVLHRTADTAPRLVGTITVQGLALPLLFTISTVLVFLIDRQTKGSLQRRRYLTLALILVLLALMTLAIWAGSFRGLAKAVRNLSGVYFLYFAIALVALFAMVLPFAMFMSLEKSKLADLNNQPLFMLGFPAGISAGDLVTMVQGFTGLRLHYPYLHYVAATGVGMAVVSILLMLVFWADASAALSERKCRPLCDSDRVRACRRVHCHVRCRGVRWLDVW